MKQRETISRDLFLFFFLFLAAPSAFGGAVAGKVSFSGTAPKMGQISMGADPVCASLHPNPIYEETVVVNENGTLGNVFVYVKEGVPNQEYEVPKESIQFDQRGCHYTPHVLGIQVGQNFQIVNSDNTLHNVHSLAANSKQFNLGMPIQGMKLTKKFEKPEIMVKVKCDVHPWMNAYIGVLPHPFFSVTGDDGSFKIDNLPPGEYMVEAWHEKYGTQTQKVTVSLGTTSTDFGYGGN